MLLNHVFRPVGIYKQDYLTELYSRYDDVDDTPPAPNLPDWCIESDDSHDQNGQSEALASTSSLG